MYLVCNSSECFGVIIQTYAFSAWSIQGQSWTLPVRDVTKGFPDLARTTLQDRTPRDCVVLLVVLLGLQGL